MGMPCSAFTGHLVSKVKVAWTQLLLQIQGRVWRICHKGTQQSRLGMQRQRPSPERQSSFRADAHRHQRLLAFGSLSKVPVALRTLSKLAQRFSIFRTLNLIPISPRESFLDLPIFHLKSWRTTSSFYTR